MAGGVRWRDVKAIYDKVGGQRRPVVRTWVKVNGQWRQTFINARDTYFKLKTTNHTGWILLVVNFFPTSEYNTGSWLEITNLKISGQQVWPAAS